MSTSTLAIVLAAGEGKRMKSSLPKVLHTLGGKPLLGYVLETLKVSGIDSVVVVIGPNAEQVESVASQTYVEASISVQSERLGTAHAVLAAREHISRHSDGEILVLFGDTPFLSTETIGKMRQEIADGLDVVVSGFYPEDNRGYGRLIMEDGGLIAIREERDATSAQKEIRLCNGGIMGFSAGNCLDLLTQVDCDNAQGEYYLTDTPEIACQMGLRTGVVEVEEREVLGVNTADQLLELEKTIETGERY